MTDTTISTTSQITKRGVVVHPFLFAVFPILSLYSNNVGQALFSEAIAPILIGLAATIVLSLALRPLLTDAHRRGLVISGIWTLFYAYGPLLDFFRSVTGFREVFGSTTLIVVAIGGGLICLRLLRWLRRTERSFAFASAGLNRLSFVAVAVTVAYAGFWRVQQLRLKPVSLDAASKSAHTDASSLPCIYYLILDSYTRADYMYDSFKFDNSAFINDLEQRGFYVADQSRSNYSMTKYSLPSSLNMNYLDALVPSVNKESLPADALLAQLIQNNGVVSFLKNHGYQFITFPSGYALTQITSADVYVGPAPRITEFQGVLISSTPIRSILNRLNSGRDQSLRRWDPDRKNERTSFIFDYLSQLKRDKEPFFVFAHLMSPHVPHRFDADGRVLDRKPPFRSGYVGEVQYLNREVIRTVDAILSKNPHSVLVIQADHGPWTDYYEGHNQWPGTKDELVRDRTAILNAYYLPDVALPPLYPTISPVNTFRLIFNLYLGADFEMLPDKSCVCWRDGCSSFFWTQNL